MLDGGAGNGALLGDLVRYSIGSAIVITLDPRDRPVDGVFAAAVRVRVRPPDPGVPDGAGGRPDQLCGVCGSDFLPEEREEAAPGGRDGQLGSVAAMAGGRR